MKKNVLISLTAIALFSYIAVFGVGENYGTGTMVGKVSRFTYRGLYWKNWEGALTSERTNGVALNLTGFGAQDPEVIQQVKNTAGSNSAVELTYKEWFMPPLSVGADRIVVAVRIIAPGK